MEQIQQQVTAMQADIKAMAKTIRKVLKAIEDPDGEKAKARSENNSFNKPTSISDELAKFIGVKGKEPKASRSDVTRKVNQYINDKGLKDEKDRRIIKPDKALAAILKPEEGKTITFLNLQTYLKPHYLKPADK